MSDKRADGSGGMHRKPVHSSRDNGTGRGADQPREAVMSFDRNPRANAADVFIAGKTTDAIVGAIASAFRGEREEVIPGVSLKDAVLALDARFQRKAERKAASAIAE